MKPSLLDKLFGLAVACSTIGGVASVGGWAHYVSGLTNGAYALDVVFPAGLALFSAGLAGMVGYCVIRLRTLSTARRLIAVGIMALVLALVFRAHQTADFEGSFISGFRRWACRRVSVDLARSWLKSLPPSPLSLNQPLVTCPVWIQSMEPSSVIVLPNNEAVMFAWRDDRTFSRAVLVGRVDESKPGEAPEGEWLPAGNGVWITRISNRP